MDKDGNIINNTKDPELDKIMWYWRISTRWKAIDTPPITGVPEELSTTGVQGKKALIQKQTLRKMRAISVRTRRWIDDKSSIENKSPEDQHVTINDISTIQEINTGQLGLDPQTGGEIDELAGQTEPDLPTHQHNYKLRPWPTEIAKPHVHVLMTHMKVREGIWRKG